MDTKGAESWSTLRDAALPLGSLSHEVARRPIADRRRYPPMREKMSRKGAPPQAEVTKSL